MKKRRKETRWRAKQGNAEKGKAKYRDERTGNTAGLRISATLCDLIPCGPSVPFPFLLRLFPFFSLTIHLK